jgi:hypothetical protein
MPCHAMPYLNVRLQLVCKDNCPSRPSYSGESEVADSSSKGVKDKADNPNDSTSSLEWIAQIS